MLKDLVHTAFNSLLSNGVNYALERARQHEKEALLMRIIKHLHPKMLSIESYGAMAELMAKAPSNLGDIEPLRFAAKFEMDGKTDALGYHVSAWLYHYYDELLYFMRDAQANTQFQNVEHLRLSTLPFFGMIRAYMRGLPPGVLERLEAQALLERDETRKEGEERLESLKAKIRHPLPNSVTESIGALDELESPDDD